MSQPLESDESNPDLEVITRVILIFGIIIVIGGIFYVTTRPEEQDVLFFLLNEDQVMRDYPSNVTAGEPLVIHTYIENILGDTETFAVRIYNTTNEYWINSTIGVAEDPEVTYIANQTIELNNKEEWISNPFEIVLTEPNTEALIICELWQLINGNWCYKPDFLLTFRVSVLSD